MSRTLYTEKKTIYGHYTDAGPVIQDQVSVQVRLWTDENMIARDIVIEQSVYVDGEQQFVTLKAYNQGGHDSAKFIRMGIQIFDNLVAAHPTLRSGTFTCRPQGCMYPPVGS